MRLPIVAAVLLIAASHIGEPMIQVTGGSSGASGSMPATLESLRDRYRPLLIFAPTDKDARCLKQSELLAGTAAQLHERQVVIVALSYRRESESGRGVSKSSPILEFSKEEASRARRRFHIGPLDFAVVLIGKDGGEKFRSHTPVTIERLNAVIDAMPMRQQEIRNGNSK